MDYKEKAKAYDEAIKKVNDYYEGKTKLYSDVDKTLNYLFPELKESEDERIRKALMQNLKERFGTKGKMGEGLNMIDVLAWFERQGEQVPIVLKFREGDVIEYKSKQWTIIGVDLDNHCYDLSNDECVDFDTAHYAFKLVEQTSPDKVKPKFHEGQWIVWQDKCYKVNYNGCGYELVDQDGLSTSLEYGTVEKSAHVFTIQDAKEGDVLAVTMFSEGTWIGIFKEQNGCTFSSYCFLNTEGTFKLGTYSHGNGKIIHPATKEQRDLLFQKMHEAGYEWNAEKKELKKIEQKSNNNQFTPEQASVLDSHIDKFVEQKPAWGEEDEEMLENIIICADKDYFICKEHIDWLKSLKDRLQPKQEWCEEDEKKRTLLISILEVNHPNGYFKVNPANTLNMQAIHTEELVSWLKSLKEKVGCEDSKKQGEQKVEEIDEEYKIGKWFTGLIPCWINAPSTLQPEHSNHGKNVVAVHLKGGGYRCCCVDDKKPITFSVAENTPFVEGWHNRESSAWSEKDKKTLERVIRCIENHDYMNVDDIHWLKSLKERYTWKPSDEQMEALESATENCAYSEYQDCLRELIGQLKKLKGK